MMVEEPLGDRVVQRTVEPSTGLWILAVFCLLVQGPRTAGPSAHAVLLSSGRNVDYLISVGLLSGPSNVKL